MPITQNDVRLYASERMTDNADGGGRMAPTVVVDGLDNNVFHDVTDIERLTGRTALRKVFGAVTSADTDTYLSAHALLDDAPDDASTGAVILATGGYATERAAAVAALQTCVTLATIAYVTSGSLSTSLVSASWTGGATSLTLEYSFSGDGGWNAVAAGQWLSLNIGGVRTLVQATAARAASATVAGLRTITLTTTALPGAGAQSGSVQYVGIGTPRCYGVALAPGSTSIGSTVVVESVWARIVPVDAAAAYPADNPAWGISGTNLAPTQGRVQIIAPNDPVLIHHTATMAPATVANAQVVNTGRTMLARLRVVGNSGVEHARFTRGITPPGGVGCTADLDAGTVTFSDVSGMSQPVTVEHRIEELAAVQTISGTTLNLNRTLARSFPAGTKVSSLLMLGDLQGRAQAGFAQQAWTGAWSDARVGGEPLADFNDVLNPITSTNAGAVSERWAVIFSNTTSYRVIGEFLGEIGTGNTGANFAPNNPSTGAPYFTIPAAGWGTGWAAGNVYRFNTVGAQAPLWALRCVAPSVPGGNDSVTLEFRGYVNA